MKENKAKWKYGKKAVVHAAKFVKPFAMMAAGMALSAVPYEAKALFAVAKAQKAQGSLEYIMMIAAASVVIVVALAMIVKLRGAVSSNVIMNGNSMGISQAIATEISNLSKNIS